MIIKIYCWKLTEWNHLLKLVPSSSVINFIIYLALQEHIFHVFNREIDLWNIILAILFSKALFFCDIGFIPNSASPLALTRLKRVGLKFSKVLQPNWFSPPFDLIMNWFGLINVASSSSLDTCQVPGCESISWKVISQSTGWSHAPPLPSWSPPRSNIGRGELKAVENQTKLNSTFKLEVNV